MASIMHATYTKPNRKKHSPPASMTIKRVVSKDKKGKVIAFFVCAKKNQHQQVMNKVVRGNK
jgi:hypothetical protein